MAEEPTHEAKTVKLAVAWPVDSHRYGGSDDNPLVVTQEGTEVPASKAKGIIEGAASTGVRVYEVEA